MCRLPVTGMAVHVTKDMLKADYWLGKCENTTRPILSAEEIQNMNRSLRTDLYARDFAELCNLAENGQQERRISWGFSVCRCAIRRLPVEESIFDSAEDPFFDPLQESSVLLNEPVIIRHADREGGWYDILTNYAAGWVKASQIAVCKSFSQWRELQEKPFAIITQSKFSLDQDPSNPLVSELELTMGTKLPLACREDVLQTKDGRTPYSCYAVKIPFREAEGRLNFTLGFLPVSRGVSLGYLPYTRRSILELAFDSLGERYGWGGMFGAKDCSQYVMELYRCFGFLLGRNTVEQMAMHCPTLSFKGRTMERKKEMLDTVSPGSPLYFPGHAMLYLGKEQGRYYVISAVGTMNSKGDLNGGTEKIHTITVNDLSVRRPNGCTWMESLSMGKNIEIKK